MEKWKTRVKKKKKTDSTTGGGNNSRATPTEKIALAQLLASTPYSLLACRGCIQERLFSIIPR